MTLLLNHQFPKVIITADFFLKVLLRQIIYTPRGRKAFSPFRSHLMHRSIRSTPPPMRPHPSLLPASIPTRTLPPGSVTTHLNTPIGQRCEYLPRSSLRTWISRDPVFSLPYVTTNMPGQISVNLPKLRNPSVCLYFRTSPQSVHCIMLESMLLQRHREP